MIAQISRRLAAEAVGTALLVATVVGTGLMAQQLTDDVALQLLTNALTTAAMLGVLIALLAPHSGAHFNPAVTMVMVLDHKLQWSEALRYVGAQTIGAIAGTWLAHAMFGRQILQIATTGRFGPGLWLAEALATFGLVAVVLLGRNRPNLPVLVAAYLGAAYWFTASTSFANPAVTMARMFTDSFAGVRPLDGVAFVAAQLAGAALAWRGTAWLGSAETRRQGP